MTTKQRSRRFCLAGFLTVQGVVFGASGAAAAEDVPPEVLRELCMAAPSETLTKAAVVFCRSVMTSSGELPGAATPGGDTETSGTSSVWVGADGLRDALGTMDSETVASALATMDPVEVAEVTRTCDQVMQDPAPYSDETVAICALVAPD